MSFNFALVATRPDAARDGLTAWMAARPAWSVGAPSAAPSAAPYLPVSDATPYFSYAHPTTGVYFEAFVGAADRPRDEVAIGRVNLVRPRPFALEAAAEFGELCRDVGLRAIYARGEGARGLDPDDFARRWEAANAEGLRGALAEFADDDERSFARVVLPSADVESAWRWERDAAAQALRRGVPEPARLVYALRDGRPVVVATLPPVATTLPRADGVMVAPDGYGQGRPGHIALLPWDAVVGAMGDGAARLDGLPREAWVLSVVSPALADLARHTAAPTRATLRIFPLEAVIEREVLEGARRAGPPTRPGLRVYDAGTSRAERRRGRKERSS